MNPIIVGVLVLSAITVLVFLRSGVAPNYSVTVTQLPQVVAALAASGKKGSFAVFVFVPGTGPDAEVNLQYSIETDAVGLDWVLLSPRNIKDKDAVADIIRRSGHGFAELEMNGVRYLRVQAQGIEELGASIITKFYGVSADAPLDLIVEGFEWPKGAS